MELVDLDDYDIPDLTLYCNSNDMDDDDTPKLEGMDVGDSGALSSQCLEPKLGPAAEPVPSVVSVHSDCPSEAILFVHDPLFNVVGKAPHLDALIVK